MPKVKTLHVPRCGSQQSSGQRNGPDRDQTVEQAEPTSRLSCTKKCGNKRGNDKCDKTPLKVKLTKLSRGTLPGKVTKDDKTPSSWMSSWMLEPNKLKTAANRGTIRDPASPCDVGDVFSFSQRSNIEATNEKEKAKLSVLRTISKMLEENQLIRQRLAAFKLSN